MLTQKELKRYLRYNAKSGVFQWIVGPNKHKEFAGTVNSLGYVVITINSNRYLAHRLAYLYEFGEFPSENIDHINRVRSDNRMLNLREFTQSQNMRNAKMLRNNMSGVTGVYFDSARNRWVSQIKIKNKNILCGRYIKKTDAVVSRFLAETKYGFSADSYYKTSAFIYLEKYASNTLRQLMADK